MRRPGSPDTPSAGASSTRGRAGRHHLRHRQHRVLHPRSDVSVRQLYGTNVASGAGKRLILYGPTAKNGPYASLSFAFTGANDGDYEFSRPIVTPRLASPLAYRPDVAEPQKLTSPDGFAITLRTADLRVEGFGEAKLYAVPVPLDKAPPFATASRLHALYVLEPLQSTLAKPAVVEFPNPNGLAVGTTVDLLQLDYQKGELAIRGTGRVRDDGKVVSDDISGVTELTWIGFAPSGS